MATLDDFIQWQKNFDSLHGGCFKWDNIITDESIEQLEFLLICLVGEVGECSNIVKKIVRGDFSLKEIKEDLSEEIIDVFIYTLKMIYQLDIDLETQYNLKMSKNSERFKKYELNSNSIDTQDLG